MSKMISWNLFTSKGTYMSDWVGRTWHHITHHITHHTFVYPVFVARARLFIVRTYTYIESWRIYNIEYILARKTMIHTSVMWCHVFWMCVWTWIFYTCPYVNILYMSMYVWKRVVLLRERRWHTIVWCDVICSECVCENEYSRHVYVYMEKSGRRGCTIVCCDVICSRYIWCVCGHEYSIDVYVCTEKSRALAGKTTTHNSVMRCHMFSMYTWTWIF